MPPRNISEYYIRNRIILSKNSPGNRVHAQLPLAENVRSISQSQIEVLKSEYSHIIDLSDFDSELEMRKGKHSDSKAISLEECRMTDDETFLPKSKSHFLRAVLE